MIADIRKAFNSTFSETSYQKMLDWIASRHDHRPPFRIAETPVFIPDDLKNKLVEACEEIVDVIVRPDFKSLSESAVQAGQSVPGETPHTTFLQMDFGICQTPEGELYPQLIEAQGFPSLYFFQDLLARAYKQHFPVPEPFTYLFNGLDQEGYIDLLRRVILGDCRPENVILLEVEPSKQATQIDFIVTKHFLGIEYVCISDLIVEGRDVFYRNAPGKKVQVERIYNRVIFDELIKRDDLPRQFHFSEEHNVHYAGHPNWFFRISKHTLPLLKSRYVPESFFLKDLAALPDDLHNYVLKPLFSFAGTGVIVKLNRYDVEAISDPEHYILQRKVEYAPVIPTPDVPSKCEIRMMMVWEDGAERPLLVNNLARLSKGDMVGTRYNRDRIWVGGSVGFF